MGVTKTSSPASAAALARSTLIERQDSRQHSSAAGGQLGQVSPVTSGQSNGCELMMGELADQARRASNGDLSDDSGSSSNINGASQGNSRRRDQTKLRVVLPANQKTLVTPTILPGDSASCATPTQLLSSLVHLNGHFTGLPSCTPSSADGLPPTSSLTSMNPFFWGVSAFDEPQKPATGESEASQRRRQQQAPNKPDGLQFIFSPLSFLLSPDDESWRRLQQQPAKGAASQQQSPTSTADLPSAANCSQSDGRHQDTPTTAQDLSSPQQQVAHSQRSGGQQQAADVASAKRASTSSLDEPTSRLHNQSQMSLQMPMSGSERLAPSSQTAVNLDSHHLVVSSSHLQLLGSPNQTHNIAQTPVCDLSNPMPLVGSSQQGPPIAHHNLFANGPPTAALLHQQPINSGQFQMLNQESGGDYQQHQHHEPHMGSIVGDPRLARQTVLCPSARPSGVSPTIRVQAPLNYQQATTFALHYDTGQPIGIYDQHLRQLYLVQQQHQQHQHQQQHQHFLYQAPQMAANHQAALTAHHHLAGAKQVSEHQMQMQFQQSIINTASQPQQIHQDRNAATLAPGKPDPRTGTLSRLSAQLSSLAAPNQLDTTRPDERQDTRTPSTNSLSRAALMLTNNSAADVGASFKPTTFATAAEATSERPHDLKRQVPLSDGCPSDDLLLKPSAAHEDPNNQLVVPIDGANTTKDLVTDCRPQSEQIKGIKKAKCNSGLMLKDQPPDSSNEGTEIIKKKSKGGRKKKQVTHEELMARKNRCKERNRVAAKRCRQKRKQFLDELHNRIDSLNDSNRRLQRENINLKGELETLKKHHKTCRLAIQ